MSNVFDEYSYEYDLPEDKKQYVDSESDAVIDPSDLTVWQELQFMAERLKFNIRKPRKGCRKCNETGAVGRDSKTRAPIPCNCIFESKDLQNVKPVSFNRKQKRQMMKNIRKNMKRQKKVNTDEQS